MKKILTVLFVFMLMVGSAIGGYFISENGLISTKNKSVTENQVVQKIDKFCNSAGWGEATTLHEKSKDKLSSISLLDSQNVTDYDKEQVDFEGRENMIKSFLYIAKYTLLTEGIKDGEFYISSSSYKNSVGEESVNTMGMYYKLNDKGAYIYLYDFNLEVLVTVIVNIQPVYNDTYVLSILMDKGNDKTFEKGITLFQLYLDQYAETIFQFSMIQLATDSNDFNGLTLDKINNLYFYGCDINLNKKISHDKTSIESETTYTFDKLKSVIIEEKNKTEGVSFGLREYIEVDVLEKVYENLGYEVIKK